MFMFYVVCAVVGGALMIFQFVMLLLGLEHDAGDLDVIDAGDLHDGSEFFGVLSIRTVTTAVAFFGIAGMAGTAAQMGTYVSFLLAVTVGMCALLLIAWLMRMLFRLQSAGNVRIDNALGASGTVYLGIPGHRRGHGKVTVSVQRRTMEYPAVTAGETLATGTPVTVVGIVGSDTLEVAAEEDDQGTER